MNYSIIISSLFRLLYLFSPFFQRNKNKTFTRLLFGGAYFFFWGAGGGGGGGGAYYRSLISSLQQMHLLLGGAYYRGAFIIGSLRYFIYYVVFVVCLQVPVVKELAGVPLPYHICSILSNTFNYLTFTQSIK